MIFPVEIMQLVAHFRFPMSLHTVGVKYQQIVCHDVEKKGSSVS